MEKIVEGKRKLLLAGNSGYCNHVMAMLYEIADYSLNSLKCVPTEIVCTSEIRQWGRPGERGCRKAPVMQTTIQKDENSRRISSTLYNPRRKPISNVAAENMRSKLCSKDLRIGFAHCMNFMENDEKVSTEFGDFPTGSTLANQLSPVEFDVKLEFNIEKCNIIKFSVQEFVNLPINFTDKHSPVVPGHWTLTDHEAYYYSKIRISNENSKKYEEDTSVQKQNWSWNQKL